MAKYHIGKNGPAVCRATVRDCPIGGEEVHFTNKTEAQTAYEKNLSKELGVFAIHKVPAVQVLESKAKVALEERDVLGRAESILSTASSNDDPVTLKVVWSEVKDLPTLKNYSMRFSKETGPTNVKDFQRIVNLARDDVEYTIDKYTKKFDLYESELGV